MNDVQGGGVINTTTISGMYATLYLYLADFLLLEVLKIFL